MKKPTRKTDVCKQVSHVLVAAVTGQARLSVTVLVFSTLALILLAYVSTQIYSGVLFSDITRLKQEIRIYREEMNTLTSDHIAASSRERVVSYCEDVLGMVPANGLSLELVAVEKGAGGEDRLFEFSERNRAFADKFSSTLLGVSESLSK